MHTCMYTYRVRVCPYLNIGHNDEVHSSSLSVLSSAAVQGLRNWDYPSLSDYSQDVVLLINLQYVTAYIIYIIHNVSRVQYYT